jgi:hypothetical protein
LRFEEEYPSLESFWRAIILFGRNSASYKFSMAKSLIEMIPSGKSFITLEELAIPFSNNLIEHLKINDKQTTSQSSTMLNACRQFIAGEITNEQLIQQTVKYGFVNVLDAFHVVNQGDIPVTFFENDKKAKQKGIVITDDLFKLKETNQFTNFNFEVEARWRLVETAWSIGVAPSLIQVQFEENSNLFYINNNLRRIDVTSGRDALNGYQKGKCFYCFDDITIDPLSEDLADVDHFFPYLIQSELNINLNGVWNLVLACKSCNRGANGKFARVPKAKFLDRLHKRNSFMIDSHHPLRETLINQSGKTEVEREKFLGDVDRQVINKLIHRWQPVYEFEQVF